MTPEERREDAELAVDEWREELRNQRPEVRQRPVTRTRRVWRDTGSGPGVMAPEPDDTRTG